MRMYFRSIAVVDWIRASRGFSPLHFACDDRDHARVRSLLRSDDTNLHALSDAGVDALAVALSTEAPMAKPRCDVTVDYMVRANLPWSKATHELWPQSFRKVVAALLCGRGEVGEGRVALPKELLMGILGFCGRGWWFSGALRLSV